MHSWPISGPHGYNRRAQAQKVGHRDLNSKNIVFNVQKWHPLVYPDLILICFSFASYTSGVLTMFINITVILDVEAQRLRTLHQLTIRISSASHLHPHLILICFSFASYTSGVLTMNIMILDVNVQRPASYTSGVLTMKIMILDVGVQRLCNTSPIS